MVKLVRSLSIIPLCSGLQLGRHRTPDAAPVWRSFPWFIVAFVAASIAAGTGVLPVTAQAELSGFGRFLITVSLAAMGTTLTADRMRAAGARPIVFGGLLAALIAMTGLAMLCAGSSM